MTSNLKCPYTEEELKEIRNNFKGDKLICPFCQQDLRTVLDSPFYTCDSCGHTGYKQLWDALIQAKQDLEQSEKCCSAWVTQALDYKAETIALSGKLEIATKALKRLEKELYFNNAKQTGHIADSVISIPSIALEQIGHKE